ncbi:unnamed protein product [Blepharisma stoltei]|uniref:Aldose 1-epimerase n=1 Tax=Blepharisma stoltei TaxID=1481888 RepID=A0AAU9J387_9CILI|nr:unnamed protein product [Blepharisma stoltei]
MHKFALISEDGKFVVLAYHSYLAKISVEFGAALEFLSFNGQAIVDFIADSQELVNNYRNYYSGAILAPFAGRIPNGTFTFQGNTYSFPLNNGENAIHGYVADKPFEVKSIGTTETSSHATLECKIEPINGFPFTYRCQASYEVNELGLHMEVKIINESENPMPCFLGFHPYFCHSEKINTCVLDFWPSEKYVMVNVIPTGEKIPYHHQKGEIGNEQYDDCFIVEKQEENLTAVLANPVTNLETYIYASPSMSHLQIYTPPHRASIAIEPQMAPANAFNLYPDAYSILPGQEMSFWCKIKAKVTN